MRHRHPAAIAALGLTLFGRHPARAADVPDRGQLTVNLGSGVASGPTISVRFTTNAALSAGPALAIATNRVGTESCGVDTCDAWSQPGNYVFMLRAGFGAAF